MPKKGSDLTYLLRWTAKPGAVIGDPTACKVFSAGSIKNIAQAVASMMNLTRILAHLLDINTAQKNSQRGNWRRGKIIEPAMDKFQVVSQIRHAGIRGKNKSGRRNRKTAQSEA